MLVGPGMDVARRACTRSEGNVQSVLDRGSYSWINGGLQAASVGEQATDGEALDGQLYNTRESATVSLPVQVLRRMRA